jgi:hypothetical protein
MDHTGCAIGEEPDEEEEETIDKGSREANDQERYVLPHGPDATQRR